MDQFTADQKRRQERRDCRRHARLYRLFRPLLALYLRLRFRFTCDPAPAAALDGPCLILANHNTDYDPLFMGVACPRPMYFVASEHVFRMPVLRWFLRRWLDPISRLKGGTDADAALQIVRRLRAGHSVMMFAEGYRSYDGRTGPISPATGRLAKVSGVPLVTYRFSGGYLLSPLWSPHLRKGPLHAQLMQVYSAEQLKEMSVEQVNAAIRADLAQDDAAWQQQSKACYPGRRLAEYLEYALYLCPQCGRIGSLHSQGDRFACDCGLQVRFGQDGRFHQAGQGTEPPFATVAQWDDWQSQTMAERVARAAAADPAVPLFADRDQAMTAYDGEHHSQTLGRGDLSMDCQTLRCCGREFPLAEIDSMSRHGRDALMFACQGRHYEVTCSRPRSPRKYLLAFHQLTGKPAR